MQTAATLRCLVVLAVIASMAVVACDYNFYYPHSIRTSIRVDMSAIGDFQEAWFTTSPIAFENIGWQGARYETMQRVSNGHYIIEVGASRKTSVMFGRHGTETWWGHLAILVLRKDKHFDRFVVQADPRVFRVNLNLRHRVQSKLAIQEQILDKMLGRASPPS